jgi:DNA mismatch repair protein MutS
MAGKSTYIRQTALLMIMAQMGMPVPVKEMVFSPVDRLYTRIGAADELAEGQSTFMVEMSECAHILRSATEKSLIIFDEVGRGTSTLDGLAIARAIVEHLLVKLPARTLFATHYHELTLLSESFPSMKNANVLVREWKDDIVFLHQVVPGATDRSYGIHVAKIAGLPGEVIQKATKILNELKVEELWPVTQNSGERQLELFVPSPSKLLNNLDKIDIDNTTPLEALKILAELKEEASS